MIVCLICALLYYMYCHACFLLLFSVCLIDDLKAQQSLCYLYCYASSLNKAFEPFEQSSEIQLRIYAWRMRTLVLIKINITILHLKNLKYKICYDDIQAIAWSVLRSTASDYPLDIFKLFFLMTVMIEVNQHDIRETTLTVHVLSTM